MMDNLIAKLKKLEVKHVVKVFSILFAIVMIVLMTITNIGIDEEFNIRKWISNSLIIFGIIIYGLLIGESTGRDRQQEKVNGLYQLKLKEYNDYRTSIDKQLIYFGQFYSWFLPQQVKEKRLNFMIANCIDIAKATNIAELCDLSDINILKESPIKKGEIFISKLTDEEYEIVSYAFSNKLKLDVSSPNYYLSAFSNGELNKTMLEEGKHLEKERTLNRRNRRIIKIVSSLIFSLVFGILTVNDFIKAGDTQAWVNLSSRIAALFTSLASGWTSGIVDVKIMAKMLINKIMVLTTFMNCLTQKTFIPKLEQDMAREEYEAWLKTVEKGE